MLMVPRVGSFYAFILERTKRVRLTVVARSNYEAVKKNVGALLSDGKKKISTNAGLTGTANQEREPWRACHPSCKE